MTWPSSPVWLFDLDDTLHDATRAAMPGLRAAFGAYIMRELGLSEAESDALRSAYWRRYGATLLGLVRHHGVRAEHFLRDTHQLPGLEARIRGHRPDLVALTRLPGRKVVLTNAPADYAARVLGVLGIGAAFDRVMSIENMRMFGSLRPKPDARMLRRVAVRLRVAPARCVARRGHARAPEGRAARRHGDGVDAAVAGRADHCAVGWRQTDTTPADRMSTGACGDCGICSGRCAAAERRVDPRLLDQEQAPAVPTLAGVGAKPNGLDAPAGGFVSSTKSSDAPETMNSTSVRDSVPATVADAVSRNCTHGAYDSA